MHAAKTHLSRLIERACAGEDVVIARGRRPSYAWCRYRHARLGVGSEPCRERRALPRPSSNLCPRMSSPPGSADVRVLLDTHALLWWLDGDRRLPSRVRGVLANSETTVFVSAASVWEITTKARLGKLPGALEVAADVAACLASQGFSGLPISIDHAQRAGGLPGPHRDPFDRHAGGSGAGGGHASRDQRTNFRGLRGRRLW